MMTFEQKVKILKPSVNNKSCYARIPIAMKIIGTGPSDSDTLINLGIPPSLCDLSYHIPSCTYSLDSTLANNKDYRASFSTTRLLQLLPTTFERNGTLLGIMLYPGEPDSFGRSSLTGVIVDINTGDPVDEIQGHPVTVLVQLIKLAAEQ